MVLIKKYNVFIYLLYIPLKNRIRETDCIEGMILNFLFLFYHWCADTPGLFIFLMP